MLGSIQEFASPQRKASLMPAEPSVLMSVPQSLSRSRASASLDLLRRLLRTRFGGIGLIILVVISALSAFAPWFASNGPMDLGSPALQPPSWQHPLGTDSLGRDVRSVLLYAGRSSLTIGFCAAAMAFLIGGTIGAMAGYFRDWRSAWGCGGQPGSRGGSPSCSTGGRRLWRRSWRVGVGGTVSLSPAGPPLRSARGGKGHLRVPRRIVKAVDGVDLDVY